MAQCQNAESVRKSAVAQYRQAAGATAWLAVSLRSPTALGEGQKSESASGEARGGGGLGPPKALKISTFAGIIVQSELTNQCEAYLCLVWGGKIHRGWRLTLCGSF